MNDGLASIIEAERLLMAGDLNGAARVAGAAIDNSPQVALALNILGIVAAKQGNSELAFTLWNTATRAGPAVAQPWVSLGEAFFHIGKFAEAAEAFREALARQPQMVDVLLSRGIALQRAGRMEDAIDALRRGIAHRPDHSEARLALATALHEVHRTDQAIPVLEEAVRHAPGDARAWSNLGVLHEKLGEFERALPAYDQAIRLSPDDPNFYNNRASSLIQLLRLPEARRDWMHSMQLLPGDPAARNNLAILELLDGNFKRGFELFEARFEGRHRRFPIPAPEWDGSPLNGRHLLLYVEQGLGDAIQFCRYIPLLKKLYGNCRITLSTLPTLHPLLASLQGLDQAVDVHPPYPLCDVQCSLLSLPHRLGTTRETIPAQVPYLHADPVRLPKWSARLAHLKRRKVGLFWQGTKVDPLRTIKLRELVPRAADSFDLVSFQKGPGEEEIPSCGVPLTHIGQELLDFGDTAAALRQMDLLITIDTSIAHAAGAMGIPTFTLLPYRPDWRWLLNTDRSPWYPTMTLFRQAARGEWQAPLTQIATLLQQWK